MSIVKYIINKKQNKVLILLALISLLPIISFKSGRILALPTFLPFDPYNYLKEGVFSWSDLTQTGITDFRSLAHVIPERVFFTLMSFFGISFEFSEKIYIVLIFQFLIFSIFYLGKTLFIEYKDKYILCFILTIIFLFNPFFIIAFNNPVPMFIISYSWSVIILALIVKLVKSNRPFKYVIYISFLSLILSGVCTNIASVVAAMMMFFLFLTCYLFFNKKNAKNILLFSIIAFSLYFLINSWSLVPQIFGAISGDISPKGVEIGANYNEVLLNLNSKNSSILNVLRTKGFYGWYDGFRGDPYYPDANVLEKNPIYIILSFSLPILAYFCLLLRLKKREGFFICYFTLLSVIGIFILKGIHSPLGFIFKFAFDHLWGFKMFRQPYDKFGIILPLCYSVLGTYSLHGIKCLLVKNNISFRFSFFKVTIIIVIICFATTFRWFYGEMFSVGGKRLKPLQVAVPDYYFKFSKILRNKDKSFRALALPMLPYDVQLNKWGYVGNSFLSHFKNYPLITSSSNLSNTNNITKILSDVLEDKDSNPNALGKFFSLLNIKTIFIDKSVYVREYNESGKTPTDLERTIKHIRKMNSREKIGEIVYFDYTLPIQKIHASNGTMK